MQGTTGSFSINGTDIQQPTEHGWSSPELVGISGEGRPVYPSDKKYEMAWNLMSMSDYSQLVGFYNSIRSSGSVVVDIPAYATSPYQFKSYSGVTLEEPTTGKFYNEYVQDVSLLVLNIRVI